MGHTQQSHLVILIPQAVGTPSLGSVKQQPSFVSQQTPSKAPTGTRGQHHTHTANVPLDNALHYTHNTIPISYRNGSWSCTLAGRPAECTSMTVLQSGSTKWIPPNSPLQVLPQEQPQTTLSQLIERN